LTGKTYALVALALTSLIGPAIEVAVTGDTDPFSKFGVAESLFALAAIFWWYHLDKAQRNFRAGILQNGGVLAVAVIALPIYFIRSRGWKQGGIATLKAAGVLAAMVALGWLGELIGNAIAS
jgi:hypothetical protein